MIVDADSVDDAHAHFLAVRAVSIRVPILVLVDDVDLHTWAGHVDVVAVDTALGGSAVADAVRSFVAHCEARANWCHRRIDRFAALRGLTPMQADLLFRLAMGVRQRDVHAAQRVAASTKKERIDQIREKCWGMTLDAIVELALVGSAPFYRHVG